MRGRQSPTIAMRTNISIAALLAGLAFAAPAQAGGQDEEAAPAEGEIIVTATRAGRDGSDAPTPTTAIGADFIEASIRPNVADVINLLPQASVSATPRSTIGNSINAGANLINLRALGTARTLVLLDGRRVAPSTIVGAGVDINVLPTALLKRVDVVTGGASAIWGSDAMAGVVNFVLDHDFTGLKANVEGGVSGQGDGEYYQGELAWGTGFAGGRGHLLLSAQYADVGRVGGPAGRDWYKGYKVIANQAFTAGSGLPTRAILPGVGLAQATGGGLITAGPLRGIQFGPGGVPLPFSFGYASGSVSVGGTAEDWGGNMEVQSPVWNASAYGRLSYELTPAITAFAEYSFSRAKATFTQVPYWRLANITIQRDNAFLHPDVATRMTNAAVTNFQMGSYNPDIGPATGVNDRRFQRWVAGLYGELGGGWEWDVYYQGGRTHLIIDVFDNPIAANYNLAIDAVRSNGAIVCRSTLANPTNGCIPLNIFGVGSGAPAAIKYVTGTEHHDQYLDQDVVAASIRGEPLALPGGPLSVAAGFEYRREEFFMTADPISAAGGFFLNNFKAAAGDFDVKEAFAEVVAPVLGDLPLIEELSLNGAVRFTDYSSSGSITTWKLGGIWDVDGALRFRGTLSRDIRAPNLYEIYQPSATFTQSVNDPVTNTSYNATIVTPGNNQLLPEVADTKSLGLVYQPRWAPGLLLSADYFDISIKDAIGSPRSRPPSPCARRARRACAGSSRAAATGGSAR